MFPTLRCIARKTAARPSRILRGAPGGDDYHQLWVDPKNSYAADPWHRPGNDHQPQLRQDVVFVVQPADGAVLSRHHRQRVSLSRLRRTAGHWRSRRSQPHRSWTNHRARLVHGWRRRERLAGARSQRSQHPLRDGRLRKRRPLGPPHLAQPGHQPVADARTWTTEINERKYRDPWTPMLVFSPIEKNTLYLGTQYVMKTTDGGLHWEQISPDLTGAAPNAPDEKPDGPTTVAEREAARIWRGVQHRAFAVESRRDLGGQRHRPHPSHPRRRQDLAERDAARASPIGAGSR